MQSMSVQWSGLIVLCGMAALSINGCVVASPSEGDSTEISGSGEQGVTAPYPAIDFSARPTYVANNVLGLTFDDGPDSTNTALVLDILKSKGVRATFFINTDNYGDVNTDPALKADVQRIVAEGHVLGSHSVHHLHLPTLSAANVESEITGVQTTVNRSDVLGAAYPKITLFRDPFGEPHQGGAPGQADYDLVAPIVAKYAVHVGWAIDPTDYNCITGTAAQNKQCVLTNVEGLIKTPGTGDYGIILMHAVQPQTAAALPDLIDYMRSNGFVFKTAEEFVQALYGKSSNEIVYGTGTCSRSPFGGAARAVPGQIEAEDFDNGGQNCAYSDSSAANQGGQYRATEQVDIQATTDTGGGFNIGWVTAGEYLTYTVNVATAGNYKLELRGSATAVGKTVNVLVGSTVIANNLAITNTGNFQTFATVSVPSVALAAGNQVLKVVFNQAQQNLNWIRLSSTGSSFSYFEAESGTGATTAPLSTQTDTAASNGKYVWSGTTGSNAAVPTNGHLSFTFTAPTAGSYKVWGRFLVGPATTADDSLWVRIDNSAWVQWNDIFPRVGNAGYAWDSEHDTVNGNASVTHTLTAGSHQLEVAYRENGLKMDRFLVTNDLAFAP